MLNSAILHALNDAIDERVLEASTLTALNRIRAEQAPFWTNVTIQRELSLIGSVSVGARSDGGWQG